MNREEQKRDDVPGHDDGHENEPQEGFAQRGIDLDDASHVPTLSALWQMPPGHLTDALRGATDTKPLFASQKKSRKRWGAKYNTPFFWDF